MSAHDDDDAPTLRVEARFRNARLYDAIERDRIRLESKSPAGQSAHDRGPVRSWCEFHGLNVVQVYELINLRKPPWARHYRRDGGAVVYRRIAKDVAAALGVELEWLYPTDLYRVKWPRLARSIDHRAFVPLLEQPATVFALPPAQDQALELEDLRRVIAGALERLTPREERIVRARYGLDSGGEGESLEAIAERERVSRGRVHEIEMAALRKIRRRGALEEYRPS